MYQSTQALTQLLRPYSCLLIWTAQCLAFSALTITLCGAFYVSWLENCTPGRQDVVHVVISSHLSSHSFLYTITLPGPKNREMNVMVETCNRDHTLLFPLLFCFFFSSDLRRVEEGRSFLQELAPT